MAYFVHLSQESRKEFFKQLKKIFGTWGNFYKKHKISRASFFSYLSGRQDIPKKLFDKCKTKIRFNCSFEIINKVKYLKKEICSISLNENLSEIIGVLNGDGHISKDKKEVCVVGNKTELDYANYLKQLFEKSLGLKFTLFLQRNCFKLRIYCKNLATFFVTDYNLPYGNKIGRLHIPEQIKKDKLLLSAYIRGLFDTDGCFHLRRGKDPMIGITSADKIFLLEVKHSLESMGFHVSKGNERIFLYRKGEILRFFNEIKPANNKHLKKFNLFYNNMRG